MCKYKRRAQASFGYTFPQVRPVRESMRTMINLVHTSYSITTSLIGSKASCQRVKCLARREYIRVHNLKMKIVGCRDSLASSASRARREASINAIRNIRDRIPEVNTHSQNTDSKIPPLACSRPSPWTLSKPVMTPASVDPAKTLDARRHIIFSISVGKLEFHEIKCNERQE
jgi:hypothetical protein